jgi:hypothetical protein
MNTFAAGAESLRVSRANRKAQTGCAVVWDQRTTNRAGSFALHRRHRILLGARSLLYLLSDAREKSLVIGGMREGIVSWDHP